MRERQSLEQQIQGNATAGLVTIEQCKLTIQSFPTKNAVRANIIMLLIRKHPISVLKV